MGKHSGCPRRWGERSEKADPKCTETSLTNTDCQEAPTHIHENGVLMREQKGNFNREKGRLKWKAEEYSVIGRSIPLPVWNIEWKEAGNGERELPLNLKTNEEKLPREVREKRSTKKKKWTRTVGKYQGTQCRCGWNLRKKIKNWKTRKILICCESYRSRSWEPLSRYKHKDDS